MKIDDELAPKKEVFVVTEKPGFFAFFTREPWKYGPYTLKGVSINSDFPSPSLSAEIKGVGHTLSRDGYNVSFTMVSKSGNVNGSCYFLKHSLTSKMKFMITQNDRTEVTCTFNGKQQWTMNLKGSVKDLSGTIKAHNGELAVRTQQRTDKDAPTGLALGFEFVEKGKVIGGADFGGGPDYIVLKTLPTQRKTMLASVAGAVFLLKEYTFDKY